MDVSPHVSLPALDGSQLDASLARFRVDFEGLLQKALERNYNALVYDLRNCIKEEVGRFRRHSAFDNGPPVLGSSGARIKSFCREQISARQGAEDPCTAASHREADGTQHPNPKSGSGVFFTLSEGPLPSVVNAEPQSASRRHAVAQHFWLQKLMPKSRRPSAAVRPFPLTDVGPGPCAPRLGDAGCDDIRTKTTSTGARRACPIGKPLGLVVQGPSPALMTTATATAHLVLELPGAGGAKPKSAAGDENKPTCNERLSFTPASSESLETIPDAADVTCRVVHDGVDCVSPDASGGPQDRFSARSLTCREDSHLSSFSSFSAKNLLSPRRLSSRRLRSRRGHLSHHRASILSDTVVRLRPDTVSDVLRSNWFDYILCVALLCNSISTGFQVNWEVTHASGESIPVFFRGAELAFLFFFIAELGLRFFVGGGKAFFRGISWRWNLFDLLMVALQSAEVFFAYVGGGRTLPVSATTVSFLRMLRIFRILRLLRVLDLVQELHNIVYLIIGSIWPFFWAFTLLVILTYVLAIICTQLVVDTRRGDDDLSRYFGASLGESILVLFASTSGGVEWLDLVRVLSQNFSPAMGFLVCGYILFVVLVIMNLVTGVFVESAQRQKKLEDDREVIDKILSGFQSADVNGDQALTLEEFYALLQSEKLKEVFGSVGVAEKEAHRIFLILNRHGTGVLSPEEFVDGALKMSRPAKAFDLEAMRHETWQTQLCILDDIESMQHTLDKLLTVLDVQRRQGAHQSQ